MKSEYNVILKKLNEIRLKTPVGDASKMGRGREEKGRKMKKMTKIKRRRIRTKKRKIRRKE